MVTLGLSTNVPEAHGEMANVPPGVFMPKQVVALVVEKVPVTEVSAFEFIEAGSTEVSVAVGRGVTETVRVSKVVPKAFTAVRTNVPSCVKAPVEIDPLGSVQGLHSVAAGVVLAMVTVVAPVTVHASVEDPPEDTDVGVAV